MDLLQNSTLVNLRVESLSNSCSESMKTSPNTLYCGPEVETSGSDPAEGVPKSIALCIRVNLGALLDSKSENL
jgi:hypothetical protein